MRRMALVVLGLLTITFAGAASRAGACDCSDFLIEDASKDVSKPLYLYSSYGETRSSAKSRQSVTVL